MSGLEISFGVVLLPFSVTTVVIILLQEGQQQDLGAITGGTDTFLSKNEARSIDAFLSRWTRVIAIGFFVMVITINTVMFFTRE